MRPLKRLALLLLIASLAAPAFAEKVRIYRKADGTLLFTNRPPAVVREPGMLLLETRVYRDDHYARKPTALTAARRDAYDDLIADAASRWKVEFALVKAVVHAESAFDKDAVSRVGARGLMQLMPQTAAMLKVGDIHDPYENINGGARYLRMMLDRFKGNIRHALAAYNAGEANVRKYHGIPPFPETRDYVTKVVALSERYREMRVAQR
ncbi:MAG: lytic transglycosylase domain-containing protein [Pseudomonadota bacterium]